MTVCDAGADREAVAAVRSAYEHAAAGWASGPAPVYRRLAAALVGSAPEPLAGRRVLDLGAGTGVASEALVAVGAHPVGLDLAVGMLRHGQPHRAPGVAGDGRALPFRDGTFDAVLAAFSLNHVPDPVAVLGECRRVTRCGGLVLASTFPRGDDHPAKAVVEGILEQLGYRRPGWYRTFKASLAARTGDATALTQAATAAGLTGARTDRLEVEAGLDRPQVAVEWRLNMPATLGFLAGLDPGTRAVLRERATAALPRALPSAVAMLALCAHVAAPAGPGSLQ